MEDLLDPTASRTVKPRKLSRPCTHPIVALTDTHALSETTGQLVPLLEDETRPDGQVIPAYVKQLYQMPRTLVVTFGAETLLWKLHEYWQHHPRWTWRVTVTTRNEIQRKRVGYFGFKDKSKNANRYHLVIDANSFFRKHDKTPQDLLELGKEIREFCNESGLTIRPSASGIASQLLRHPAFYPLARRRVPGFVNDAARTFLPGGHYEAYTQVDQRMEAVHYIDQENAHHYAAMTTPLPNSNSVRAQGFDRYIDAPWARKGGKLYDKVLSTHGLLRVVATVPDLPSTRWHRNGEEVVRGLRDFVPRSMRTPGEQTLHLWSNEIPYLESLGLEIKHVVAAWGTQEVDKGLAAYAEWAMEQARKHPRLKALLLMPYGLLGQHETDVTFHHPGGENPLILANRFLEDTRAIPRTIKPATANVLQLGLIQAFVRSLSLDFARQATSNGHDVVSVYVDGVFVKLTKGKQLPIFRPWRIKEEYQEIELKSSLRVPVHARVKRDYQLVK